MKSQRSTPIRRADPQDSRQLAWVDHQLDTIRSLSLPTQVQLASFVADLREERNRILRAIQS